MSPQLTDNDSKLSWRKIGYHSRSVFAVLLSLGILIGGGWWVYTTVNGIYIDWRTQDDYIGEGKDPVQVVIPRGATITQIGDILTEAGVVKSTRTFRNVAQDSGEADQLQAGRFNLLTELPAQTAFDMLLDPENIERLWVTFPEGTTMTTQFDIIAEETGLSLEDINKAAEDTSVYSLPEYANGGLEGFLFPSTYAVGEPPKAQDILSTQIKQFGVIASEIGLEGRAAEIGRSARDVVITASIIAAEVSNADDQPMVAAVIYNRLDQGMKLQLDSTVIYGLGKKGEITTTQEERDTDTPYNTYLHEGLPAGPISNPGETALEAALLPADSDALYFVTVDLDTGETRFAATWEEHQANVALFQEWCQANQGRC